MVFLSNLRKGTLKNNTHTHTHTLRWFRNVSLELSTVRAKHDWVLAKHDWCAALLADSQPVGAAYSGTSCLPE